MAGDPIVEAVCVSPGGVPKATVVSANVSETGLEGDGHAHPKHIRPHRAVLIQDIELLEELRREGYPVAPGTLGENLTVRHLHVQRLSAGTRLQFDGGPLLELSEPRKPCFVLDEIHSEIQHAVTGRAGFLARVLSPGRVFTGQSIRVVPAGAS